jgi:predicted S18 family serine protease
MLYGIALISGLPFRITCDVVLKPGPGDVIISGPVEPTIEETINASIRFANELASFDEGAFPDLSNKSLHIRIGLPASPAPIVGPSYGLLLSLRLICTLLKRSPRIYAYVTGDIDDEGNVHSVGGITEKRRGALQLGGPGTNLVLPTSQLDFYSTEVIQIPVSNIYEAYRAVTYGET